MGYCQGKAFAPTLSKQTAPYPNKMSPNQAVEQAVKIKNHL